MPLPPKQNFETFSYHTRLGKKRRWGGLIGLQPALSWRASGDRQISLSASDERAFANFRVKNVVFTGTHFCAVLSMVGERAFVNFRKFVN